MNGVRIRTAQERDEGLLAEIDASCFSLPWSQDAFHQELCENPLALYLVAEVDDTMIGYAGLWGILDEGHITNVAVAAEWRGRGIAERLIQELIARGRAAGQTRFTLEVRPSNIPAITLYKKMGFMEVGRRKYYYEDNGEDALILWKGLNT